MWSRLRDASREFTAAAELWPDGMLMSSLPSGRSRPIASFRPLVVQLVSARADSPTAMPFALLANQSSSPLGVANAVIQYDTADADLRWSLQSRAFSCEPKIGVS